MAFPYAGTVAGEYLGPVGGQVSGHLGRKAAKHLLNAAGVTDRPTRAVVKFVATATSHFAGSMLTKAACHGVTLDAVGVTTALPTLGAGKSALDGVMHATYKTLPKDKQHAVTAMHGVHYLREYLG